MFEFIFHGGDQLVGSIIWLIIAFIIFVVAPIVLLIGIANFFGKSLGKRHDKKYGDPKE